MLQSDDDDIALEVASSRSRSSSSSSSTQGATDDSDLDDDSDKSSAALAAVPVLLAVVAIATDLGTILWGCRHPRVDCTQAYPTLAEASRFRPQQYLYMVGLCSTSVLWATTLGLLHWFLRLTLPSSQRLVAHVIAVVGGVASLALLCLAVFDTRAHPEGHTAAAVLVITSVWPTLLLVQHARRQSILFHRPPYGARKRRIMAVAIGEYGIVLGIVASVGYSWTLLDWVNPFQVASALTIFETLLVISWSAVVASVAAEIGALAPLVEHHDLLTLARQK
ncbi:hypothetical protein ACHHYP_07436 [Achlya hypogyna]|uniref:CWH43-like N-terminal domain-containing protein n=1 Tax=Achlya hypogyna TaxID=1202772 RepID=A0A1V9ZM35_ACHHY|nr:hypothetical protein ACHHYP_07436 [Achlya hypogyna]